MAAYAATVVLDVPHTERISRNLGILVGTCTITNYNHTLVEITGITGHFQTLFAVFCSGFTTLGHAASWNPTSKAFNVEIADDQAPGAVEFVAIGLFR